MLTKAISNQNDEMKTATNGAKYYTSIYKLPLERFLEVLIDKDLTALVIEGKPAEGELQSAWEEILTDYNDTMAGPKQRYILELTCQLYRLQLKYNRIEALVAVLRRCYVQLFTDELNRRLSVNFNFNCTDREAYMELLEGCRTRNKHNLLQIELKEIELEVATRDSQRTEEPTRAEFLKTLIILSDHAGRELDSSMTVFTYCQRIQRYNEYAQRREREAHQPIRTSMPW